MEINLETIQGQLQEIELTSPKIVNAKWGKIEGDITQQEDLQNILTLKANTSDLESLSTKDDLEAALNYKADKVITITAGAGLIGGGDLSSNKTINIESQGITPNTEVNFENTGTVPLRIGLSNDETSLATNVGTTVQSGKQIIMTASLLGTGNYLNIENTSNTDGEYMVLLL